MLVEVSATVNPMRTFHLLVVNTLVASVTNNFLWFALTFWVYLETRSVLATAIIGGGYMLLWRCPGSSSERSSTGTGAGRRCCSRARSRSGRSSLAGLVVLRSRRSALRDWAARVLGIRRCSCSPAAIAGNLRDVALVDDGDPARPRGRRDRANGLVGTANGVSFAITSRVQRPRHRPARHGLVRSRSRSR